MSELVVFVFRDQYRAPEVLNELRRRDWPWIRDLDNAVAITLDHDGRARVHLTVDLSNCEPVGWARIWGALFSTTLFLPLAQSMTDAVSGLTLRSTSMSNSVRQRSIDSSYEVQWWQRSLQTSGQFKRDVGALISLGGSAVFMLLHTANISIALKQLCNYGDTIIHTAISDEQDDKMLSMLAHG